MGPTDPELARLLKDELERHEPALVARDPDDVKRALHAMKGSASLAGQRDLAEALLRLERRLGQGDASAVGDARVIVRAAIEALSSGTAPAVAVWPEPPVDLVARPIASIDARYGEEMRDRLDRLDQALQNQADNRAAVAAAFREVHAMKAAALAAADDAVVWFCHGLEERLRQADRSDDEASRALDELGRSRLVLAELLFAPQRALESLRASRPGSAPPEAPIARETLLPHSTSVARDVEPRSGEESLRVATATLDRLLERVRQIAQARVHVTSGARVAQTFAVSARKLRLGLGEALRLIGPPRPWGAPAAAISRIEEAARALGPFADRLDEEAGLLKETADRVRSEAAAAHGELAEIRTTRAQGLFERVSSATVAEARRQGREVRFVVEGDDVAIDRRVAEQLFDPLLQLARNAVAHGIEPAAERAMRGKPRVGVIDLRAERRSGGLRIIVRDDGVGVNVADVRARAVARGVISTETARVADDATLLALLFVPGFTTRESADLLAGRGVGLDLALEVVHRLGGTIRLASEAGMGLIATLDIPFEPGLVRVIWIEASDSMFALPVRQARRVVLAGDAIAASARPLLEILDPRSSHRRPPAFAIELEPSAHGKSPSLIGVDAVGAVEEVALRILSPLVRTAGPFAGAIVRGDELRICLDGPLLSDLASTTASIG